MALRFFIILLVTECSRSGSDTALGTDNTADTEYRRAHLKCLSLCRYFKMCVFTHLHINTACRKIKARNCDRCFKLLKGYFSKQSLERGFLCLRVNESPKLLSFFKISIYKPERFLNCMLALNITQQLAGQGANS